MKNLKYIFAFLLILGSGMTYKAFANNSLIQGTVTPSGPCAGGTVITIPYSMEFTMLTGNMAELKTTYNNFVFDFVSSDLPALSSGVWIQIFSPPGTIIFQTALFNLADNNYTSTTDFTLSFRVKSASCVSLNENIVTKISTVTGTTYSDIQQVSTPISIVNTGSNPSVSIELTQGDDCTLGMYKITSFGLDLNNSTGNSTFNLTLPSGATLQNVFNTIGNPVAFTSASGSGSTIYTWPRSGITIENMQIHYVIIAFDQAILCANNNSAYQLNLEFNSYNICSPNVLITANINRTIANCCNQPPPNTIHGVVLRKTLVKYPLRYFPEPDNCKTHDYIIKVDNLTANTLDNFILTDFLNNIVPSFSQEIEVTKITASLNSISNSSTFSFFGSWVPSSYPNSGSINLSNTNPAAIVFPTGNYLDSDLKITGNTPFPKYSSLILKITHRLKSILPLPPTAYDNKAQLQFNVGATNYSGDVTFHSTPDSHDPALTIEKKVRNLTPPAGPFSNNVNANPGETVEFEIKIKNYGMANVNGVNLADVITENDPSGNPITNLSALSPFAVSGINYSSAALSAILAGVQQTSTGFNNTNFQINAAPCNGYTELIITYQATVKQPDVVVCSSIYKNIATINWEWNGISKTAQSEADVNVDLFKNILYKLEASCKGPTGPWQITNINGVPGQPIWYKASLKNNNNYSVSNLKMMVQLPNATDNSSNHGGLILTSTIPGIPSGTNLQPVSGFTYVGTGSSGSISVPIPNGWLDTPVPVPGLNSLSGNVALYHMGTIPANTEVTISYEVIVPINTFGAQYITAMGVSKYSDSCPILKQTNLTLTVAKSNNCSSISDCDLIMFNSKIERIPLYGNNFKITLFDMLNAYPGFNINNFDIVVHQPYIDIIITPSPYNKVMIPYTLDNITSNYPPFILTQPTGGQRYYKIDNVPSLNFGDVSFNILTTLPYFFLNHSHIIFNKIVVFLFKYPIIFQHFSAYFN